MCEKGGAINGSRNKNINTININTLKAVDKRLLWKIVILITKLKVNKNQFLKVYSMDWK